MLVLSRKVGEKILVGKDISVMIVRVSGGGVRIGIEAPSELNIVREELEDLSNLPDRPDGNCLNPVVYDQTQDPNQKAA